MRDDDEDRFYQLIREWVLLGLSAWSLLMMVHWTLYRHWLAKSSADSQPLSFLSPLLWSCSFALAMAISSQLVLPLTICANEVLRLFGHGNFYIRWLDGSLVVQYWNWIFIGATLALFVLLPFAYFHQEAEDGRSWRWYQEEVASSSSQWSGFQRVGLRAGASSLPNARISLISGNRAAREALIVMILVWGLVYGLAVAVRALLGLEEMDVLVVLHAAASLCSALICLRATPNGFILLWQRIASMAVSPRRRAQLRASLMECECEEQVLIDRLQTQSLQRSMEQSGNENQQSGFYRQKLAGLYGFFRQRLNPPVVNTPGANDDTRSFMTAPSATSTGISTAGGASSSIYNRVASGQNQQDIVTDLVEQLSVIQQRKISIQKDLSHNIYFQNGKFVVCLTLFITVWILFALQLGLNIIKGLFGYLADLYQNTPTQPEHMLLQAEQINLVLGRTTSFLGLFGSILELLLVCFFSGCSLLGALKTPSETDVRGFNLSTKRFPGGYENKSKQTFWQSSSDKLRQLLTMENSSPSMERLRPNSSDRGAQTESKPQFDSKNQDSKTIDESDDGILGEESSTQSPAYLLSRVALVLLLSLSMPILTRLMGVTSFDLIGYFGIYSFLKDWRLLTVGYKVLFLAMMTRGVFWGVQ